MWRRCIAILGVVLTVVANAPTALAHAYLIRSVPPSGTTSAEAHNEVRLWFSENIFARFSSAQLRDINSEPIPISNVRGDPADPSVLILSLPDLPEGVYSVLWQAQSDVDGHSSRGMFVFGIGTETSLGAAPSREIDVTPRLPEVLLRWLYFSLLAAVVGGIVVVRFVLLPKSDPPEPTIVAVRQAAVRRVFGWTGYCASLAFVVGIGLLVWQIITLLERLPEGQSLQAVILDLLGGTRWGQLWLIRETILMSLVGVALLCYRNLQLRSKTVPSAASTESGNDFRVELECGLIFSRSSVWLAAYLLSLGLIAAQAFTGHAAALIRNSAVAVVADMVHLLAASIWAGGLMGLAVALLPLIRRDRAEFATLMRAGWAPFSRLAAVSVGLLIATGLYNIGREVASFDALISTLYGRALMAKIGLILAMGAFGLLNSMLIHPTIVAAPLGRLLGRPFGWTPLPIRRLPTLVVCEVGAALLVLFATGAITAAPTPRGPDFAAKSNAVASQMTRFVDDLVVTLSADPNRPGQNVFTVFTASTRRPDPAEIMRVILRFTYLDEDVGRVAAKAEEISPGRYLLGGSYLSLIGSWQIDVVVRRKGIEDSIARFDWNVVPPVRTRPVLVSNAPLEPILTLVAGLLLIVLPILIFTWSAVVYRTKGQKRRFTRIQFQEGRTFTNDAIS